MDDALAADSPDSLLDQPGNPSIKRSCPEQHPYSLNIGYSVPKQVFIADFVFMGAAPRENEDRARAFVTLFGGEIPNRSTTFARLLPTFVEATRLKRLVQAYAAITAAAR